MRHRWLWLVGLLALALVGCEKPGKKAAPAGPPATAPTQTASSAVTTASATPAAPAEAEAEPVKAEVAAESGAEPRASLSGVLLNPADGVQILKPEGWTQIETPENGPLVRLRRTKGIDGLQVSVTLTAEPRSDLGEGAAIEPLAESYMTALGKQLEATGKVVSQRRTPLAGVAAVAVRIDFDHKGTPTRAKQWLMVHKGVLFTLTGVGPRDAFEKQVEPELNSIASTLVVP
ncbi:MAG: hypothetical protein HZB16_24875 [Armatimonadetes bacterium]|nr:hypothetical protein [Armatimonadota bacterium]